MDLTFSYSLCNNSGIDNERETMTNHEYTYSNEPFLNGALDIPIWSEVLPNLWLGGTADNDRVGDKHFEFDIQAIEVVNPLLCPSRPIEAHRVADKRLVLAWS